MMECTAPGSGCGCASKIISQPFPMCKCRARLKLCLAFGAPYSKSMWMPHMPSTLMFMALGFGTRRYPNTFRWAALCLLS